MTAIRPEDRKLAYEIYVGLKQFSIEKSPTGEGYIISTASAYPRSNKLPIEHEVFMLVAGQATNYNDFIGIIALVNHLYSIDNQYELAAAVKLHLGVAKWYCHYVEHLWFEARREIPESERHPKTKEVAETHVRETIAKHPDIDEYAPTILGYLDWLRDQEKVEV